MTDETTPIHTIVNYKGAKYEGDIAPVVEQVGGLNGNESGIDITDVDLGISNTDELPIKDNGAPDAVPGAPDAVPGATGAAPGAPDVLDKGSVIRKPSTTNDDALPVKTDNKANNINLIAVINGKNFTGQLKRAIPLKENARNKLTGAMNKIKNQTQKFGSTLSNAAASVTNKLTRKKNDQNNDQDNFTKMGTGGKTRRKRRRSRVRANRKSLRK